MTSHESRVTSHEKRTPWFALAGVLLLLDQMTKYFFSGSSGFYCNPFGPWGIPVDNRVLIAVMVVVLAGVGYLFFAEAVFLWDSSASLGMTTRGSVSYHAAFVLLFAGGVSNLLDRILFGCVRDFSFVSWFPAFNAADVFLTIGAGFLLFSMLEKKSTPLAK